MWNGKKSIILSNFCILAFIVLLMVTVGAAPWLTSWFLDFSQADLRTAQPWFLATIYIGAFPAALLLYDLLLLLRRIEAGQVFNLKNVERLRRISWCCFAGAGIAVISAVYYFPWAFLAVAAAFMGLIVRVVKNVVAQAVELQDEVDSTI